MRPRIDALVCPQELFMRPRIDALVCAQEAVHEA